MSKTSYRFRRAGQTKNCRLQNKDTRSNSISSDSSGSSNGSPSSTKPKKRKFKIVTILKPTTSSTIVNKIKLVLMVSLTAFTVFVLVSDIVQRTSARAVHASPDNDAESIKIKNFFSWLISRGAKISPSVTVASFPSFGGRGLLATSDVRHLDELYTIPSSLITTAEKVITKYRPMTTSYNKSTNGGGVGTLDSDPFDLIKKYFNGQHDTMRDQDAIISLELMVQCACGGDGEMAPYLDVLPLVAVPRLDTFSEGERDWLQDPYLADLGRVEVERLRFAWDRLDLGSLVRRMFVYETSEAEREEGGCFTFERFHYYVGIVSSRAMVIEGTKHLTPLPDMANYAPRLDALSRRGVAGLGSRYFKLYHEVNYDEEGSGGGLALTVRADRNVMAGEQIFEDYGDTDNSLFLDAHGFVPDENPFHCAVVPIVFLGTIGDEVRGVLTGLELVDPRNPPQICVYEDGSLSDDVLYDILAVVALSGMGESKMWRACIERSSDVSYGSEVAWKKCVLYEGHREKELKLLVDACRRVEREHYQTSLEKDVHILQDDALNLSEKAVLALKFRIAEKQTLKNAIASLEGLIHNNVQPTNICSPVNNATCQNTNMFHSVSITTISTDVLDDFKSFMNNLNGVSIQNIEPAIVGNGMRLGALSTKDMSINDIYFSISSNSTINLHTAIINSTPQLSLHIQQIAKHRPTQQPERDFLQLLVYLLHQRFIAKYESPWWPYLRTLPTITDMKNEINTHPLFFTRAQLDVLAGSDVRLTILKYRDIVKNTFHYLRSDYHTLMALSVGLGGEGQQLDDVLTRDHVYWGHAILDSRSIWWEGKRHLVPLLDLVNCAVIKDKDGVPNRVHKTQLEGGGSAASFAVTRLSHAVTKGEQIFENYGQPNHVYFLYHGFILPENSNPNDCVLVTTLLISKPTTGKDALLQDRLMKNGFHTYNPTFCINDNDDSLDNVANFLRVKHGIHGNDMAGVRDDVKWKVRAFLEYRLQSYDDLTRGTAGDNLLLGVDAVMLDFMQSEKRIYERLLAGLLQKWFSQ